MMRQRNHRSDVAKLVLLLLLQLTAISLFHHTAEAMLPRVDMHDINRMANGEAIAASSASPELQWTSLNPTMEYLPAASVRRRRHLEEAEGNNGAAAAANLQYYYEDLRDQLEEDPSLLLNNPYRVQPFTSGVNDYDEYQQAWRMLGFMIDCDVRDGDEWSDGAQQSHSRDDGDGSVSSDGCARFILWAAYVDLDYQGGGIGEYQYWNRTATAWDDSACQYGEGGGEDEDRRCAKMDCHLDDTHFQLLGFFKHRSYDDWMEQLFKHEGMCVWSEEEYAFMKGARKVWPQGCTSFYTMDEEGTSITMYYDIKPLSNGRITFAIYRDSQCTDEVSDDVDVVQNAIGNPFTDAEASGSQDYSNYDFSGDTLEESLARWETAFSEWTFCHPCVAFDVENTDGTKYLQNDNDGGYGYNDDAARRLGGDYEAQGEIFECYDDAGYTNVNQCMKFSAKTYMQTGTFRDMSLARLQNVMADSPLSGFYHHAEYQSLGWTNATTYLIFLASIGCCVVACVYAFRAKTEGDFNLEVALKEALLQREPEATDGGQSFQRQGSGSSSDSKEKPLIENEHGEFA